MTSVLIIEDEGDFGRTLAVTWVDAGFEIDFASSASRARLLLAEGHEHLARADIIPEGGLAAVGEHFSRRAETGHQAAGTLGAA